MAVSSRGASEDESLDRPCRRAADDDDRRGCAVPDSIPQGHLEGNRKSCCSERPSTCPVSKEAAVRDLEVTHNVLGQDGRLFWGTTSAGNNDVKEPFAWAVTADNKTVIGADTHGYYRLTILRRPDGEMLRAECRFVPESDRSVLLCHVAG